MWLEGGGNGRAARARKKRPFCVPAAH